MATAPRPAAAGRLAVVHVDAERGFSGGEKQVFLLIEGLRRAGVENTLVCPPGSACERRARELGVPCRTVPMRNDLDLRAVLRLSRAFGELRPELVHLHTGRATWLGGWAARLADRPAITTRRQDRDLRRGWRTRLVYGALTRRAVAISPAVASCLTSGGVAPERVVVIPSSVDPAALRPRTPRAQVRAELGVDERAFVLLAVGALVERKGFDVLLAALGRLAPGARPHTWIAGDGAERERLESQAAALGLGGDVRFLGRREDVPDLLAAGDAFVMPSRSEGLGVAALEALAAGRPVIASRVGGLGTAVDESCGLLVPPEDPAALAAAVARLAIDRELLARLSAAAPRRVDAAFHVDGMVAAYLRLYAEVLGRGAPAA